MIFWNRQDPILHLKLPLNHFSTQFDLVDHVRIAHVAIHTIGITGEKMDWAKLINQRIPYRLLIDQQLKLTCEQMHSKSYYIIDGISASSPVSSRNDLQNNLRELEEQIRIQ